MYTHDKATEIPYYPDECRGWLFQGFCHTGNCSKEHVPQRKAIFGDECRHWLFKGFCKGLRTDCTKEHDPQRKAIFGDERQPCQNWAKYHNCPYGDDCDYKHDKATEIPYGGDECFSWVFKGYCKGRLTDCKKEHDPTRRALFGDEREVCTST